jgi:hypothetical protein
VVEEVKTSSSKWLKTQDAAVIPLGKRFWWLLRELPAEVNSRTAYIEGQEEHHRVVSFEEEHRKSLQEYGVEYDERYVWD